jgi:hypothetical protein
LKEANNFPLEFEELPRLQQLVSLGKVPCHSHILVCAGFCSHLISNSKDVEL